MALGEPLFRMFIIKPLFDLRISTANHALVFGHDWLYTIKSLRTTGKSIAVER